MRVRDVANRLEISASLAYRLIAAGRLRCSRHGLGRGAIRVSEEQLTEYLASSECVAAQAPPQGGARRARLKHLRL